MQFMAVGTGRREGGGRGERPPSPDFGKSFTLYQRVVGGQIMPTPLVQTHSDIRTFQRTCNLMQLQKKPTPHGPLHIEQF